MWNYTHCVIKQKLYFKNTELYESVDYNYNVCIFFFWERIAFKLKTFISAFNNQDNNIYI